MCPKYASIKVTMYIVKWLILKLMRESLPSWSAGQHSKVHLFLFELCLLHNYLLAAGGLRAWEQGGRIQFVHPTHSKYLQVVVIDSKLVHKDRHTACRSIDGSMLRPDYLYLLFV